MLDKYIINRCNDCGRLLKPRTVSPSSLTANPLNFGRQLYACREPNFSTASGHCSYFRWAGPRLSPSPTPSLSRATITPSSSQSDCSNMPSGGRKERCSYLGCNKARNRNCIKAMCLSHCRQDGPCTFHMSQSRQSQSQPATTPVPTSPILPPSTTSARATPLLSSPVIQAPLSSPPAPPPVPAAIQHQHSQDCHAPHPGTSLAGPSLVSSCSNDAALAIASAAPPLPLTSPITRHSKAPARVATHMPDSFHSKFDNEQNRLREKQTQEMERKERELREKYEVIVHCLLK
ncbi:hypothetical protein BDY19DRAFT_1051954, partial [Irpex rosettiformis]